MGSHYTDHCPTCFVQTMGETATCSRRDCWGTKYLTDRATEQAKAKLERETQARVAAQKAARQAKREQDREKKTKAHIQEARARIRADKTVSAALALELVKEIARLKKELR